MAKKRTTEEFIMDARKVHGNKYDYSKVNYINTGTKVCIICPEHGDFWVSPNHHLRGVGCKQCATSASKMHITDFINQSNKIHNNKYIYDKVEYINNHTKVCIICPEHGEFWQTPANHLRGWGCAKCGNLKKSVSFEDFMQQAIEKHGTKYDYTQDTYRGFHKKTKIICPVHGEFWQTPYRHINGQGCPKCFVVNKTKTTEEFIQQAEKIHHKEYSYDETEYINAQNKVAITCPKHGIFWQRAIDHLRGYRCPKCADNNSSKFEKELLSFISDELEIKTDPRNKSVLNGLECDILIPSHKLAIECNGLYWHSEDCGKDKHYHLNKTELAESKGYHLIHIFEDEWLEHKDIVLNKIRHFLGKDLNKPVIGARKCTVKTIRKSEAEPFLVTYHIQGFVPSTAYYGAYFGDKLVGVMAFKQEKKGEWNLTRFATDTEYRLPGLASKIFKQFIKDCSPVEVKTFLDRRWSHGDVNVYNKMGFKLEKILPPDYRYVVKNQREHKFGFRKQILAKRHNLPLTMTEKKMTEQLGFHRIWDCGLYKYVWKA